MPIGVVDQLGGEGGGAIELARLDAYPNLEEAREGQAERALREAEFVGPVCGLQHLGLGAAEVSARKPVETEDSVRHGHGVGRCEPERLESVVACCDEFRRRCFHLLTRGSESAVQPRRDADAGFDHGPEELPLGVHACAQ